MSGLWKWLRVKRVHGRTVCEARRAVEPKRRPFGCRLGDVLDEALKREAERTERPKA